jgi:phosphatidylglycerol:prolipoprotein diacylglycerol transferase
MYIDGVYYHPTFLYEALWNLIGLIIMLILRRRSRVKVGQICGFYMVWYGIGRYLIEEMRTDALMYGDIKVAQMVSIILIVSGLIFILRGVFSRTLATNYND